MTRTAASEYRGRWRAGLAAACSLWIFAGLQPLQAGWSRFVRTNNGSGISIEVSSPVKESPADGFLPAWVTIHNHSGAARTWQVFGEQRSYGHGAGQYESSQMFSVGKDESARLPVLVPLGWMEGSTYYSQVGLRVEGPGVEGPRVEFGSVSTTGTNASYVAMGDALATPLWGSLTQLYKDQKDSLFGSPLDPALLPTDWRGLSGFDVLWLTEPEYMALDADRRAAIRDWLVQGGNLVICTPGLAPALRPGLGLPAEGNEGALGYGHVRLFPWDSSKPPEVEEIRGTLLSLKRPTLGVTYADSESWPMTMDVGAVPIHATFLIAFITVFALLIGPINLFIFADAKRRHRLFWTTPLIAVAASLLLMASIVLQDGFGGTGSRSMVTLLLPDEHKAFVVQEQVSRTGLLFSGRFKVAEDLVLSQIKGPGSLGSSYRQEGRFFSGDWFSNHRFQAQRIQAMVPSRAEVQVSSDGTGALPTVISSIPATLKELVYTDANGRQWHAENVATGQRRVLVANPLNEWLDSPHGSQLLDTLQKHSEHPGYFRAVAEGGAFLETLPSIRWKQQETVYIGPVTLQR